MEKVILLETYYNHNFRKDISHLCDKIIDLIKNKRGINCVHVISSSLTSKEFQYFDALGYAKKLQNNGYTTEIKTKAYISGIYGYIQDTSKELYNIRYKVYKKGLTNVSKEAPVGIYYDIHPQILFITSVICKEEPALSKNFEEFLYLCISRDSEKSYNDLVKEILSEIEDNSEEIDKLVEQLNNEELTKAKLEAFEILEEENEELKNRVAKLENEIKSLTIENKKIKSENKKLKRELQQNKTA